MQSRRAAISRANRSQALTLLFYFVRARGEPGNEANLIATVFSSTFNSSVEILIFTPIRHDVGIPHRTQQLSDFCWELVLENLHGEKNDLGVFVQCLSKSKQSQSKKTSLIPRPGPIFQTGLGNEASKTPAVHCSG